MYKCADCGWKIEKNEMKKGVRCPNCGYRVVIKERGGGAKEVDVK